MIKMNFFMSYRCTRDIEKSRNFMPLDKYHGKVIAKHYKIFMIFVLLFIMVKNLYLS